MITTTANVKMEVATQNPWSAVGAMTLCVAMLIASEFLPVSLLTPIATDCRQVQDLEDEIGVKLLRRSSSGSALGGKALRTIT